MVSFDVVSLFTSIPIDLALKVAKHRLQQDEQLFGRTDISVTNISRLLEFVLRNSYFTYKHDYYQQISGCAMGSPISATIADLVMEHIEEIAISTAPHAPRWWYRYVDDSHACLKKDFVSEFHNHLNSIDRHIQFTFEIEHQNRLAFLDTVTIRRKNHVLVDVYRKPTHTDKYLDYDSHHPMQHKRSVVNTLLDRAERIPTSNKGKRRERKHVFRVLRDNGYPLKFIKACDFKRKSPGSNNNNNSNTQVPSNNNNSNPTLVEQCSISNFVSLPYVKGVSEKISRTLRRENIKVGYRPINTIYHQFPKPKDKLEVEQTKNVIYKIPCSDCDFTYYGQTNRALKTRIKEHKRAVTNFDKYSKIAKHAEQHDHRFNFDNATIVNKTINYHERLFLEAWYSQKNPNSGNDHIDIPDIYKSLS